jgi:hypothetical protein
MNSKTVLIVAQNSSDAWLYQGFLDHEAADCGFLAVTTVAEALGFCSEMIPDCLVVDDSVDVPGFLTELAGPSGRLPCAVITIVRPEAAGLKSVMIEQGMADR